MTTIKQTRPLILLGFGFVASLVVYSHALGPYLTFEGEGPIGQILTLFLFPITATVIYGLIGSLRASRAAMPSDPAADAALNSIVFCVLLFLISIHLIVLSVLLQLEAVQPWASRGVVVMTGLTLIAVGAVTVLSGVLASGLQVAQWPGVAFLVGAIVLVAFYWKFSRVSSSARQI